MWGCVDAGERAGQEEEGKRRVPPSAFLSLPPLPLSFPLWHGILGGIEVNTNNYQFVRYPCGNLKHKPLLPWSYFKLTKMN